MPSSWPNGVTSYEDMCAYAKSLFGQECVIEDLLQDVPDFANRQGVFLIRIKGATRNNQWEKWPQLMDKAMTRVCGMYHGSDCITVKAHNNGPKERMYETMQVSPPTCTCRVFFGGDRHIKYETNSSAMDETHTMAENLMQCFEPKDIEWNKEQNCGYDKKAFHIVLNNYRFDEGLDLHKDKSETYDAKNPIASHSYKRGSLLLITDREKKRAEKSALLAR